MTTIGILALQGDFAEHERALQACGVKTVLVTRAAQMADLDGLVIPGGESTTIAKLTANSTDCIFDAMKQLARRGVPIYGTCMGTIFLARNIEGSTQGRLALMDITVRRNAFGPQKYSREQYVNVPGLGPEPLPLIFIRGPIITACGDAVEVLASVEEGIVMARQDNLLVTAFHPELTEDLRVHRYFLSMVDAYLSRSVSHAVPQLALA